jgi:uncharacterized RDD family membrane protein YckC
MIDTSFGLKTWIYPGLIWGVIMCLIITIFLPLIEGDLIIWEELYKLLIWLIVGLVMQYFMHKRINNKRRREMGEKTD